MENNEKKKLYSQMVRAGRRTYYFDLKETQGGVKYLVITESKKVEESRERSNILVFDKDIDKFYDGLQNVMQYLDENFPYVPMEESTSSSPPLHEQEENAPL